MADQVPAPPPIPASAAAVKAAAFRFGVFGRRQLQLITWWMPGSPHAALDGVIAEGAIRSGKTIGAVLGFVLWTLIAFHWQGRAGSFIVAGKSMGALKRNVLDPLFKILRALGIPYAYNRSSEDPHIAIGPGLVRYYLFAGNNEASADTLQGFTASGALLDEATLQPESFVDQVFGRCSEPGAKVWMSLNPKGPFHYIKVKYIDEAKKKRLLRLHFTLDDNPNLTPERRSFFRRMFTGTFYQRYILGRWVLAEGLVYPMFARERHGMAPEDVPYRFRAYALAVDYGSTNPTVFGAFGYGGTPAPRGTDLDPLAPAVLLRLFHYAPDSAKASAKGKGQDDEEGRAQVNPDKTDAQLADDFDAFYASAIPSGVPRDQVPVVIDPSAKSFAVALSQRGYRVVKGRNDVADGIRETASLLGLDPPGLRYVLLDEMAPLEQEMGTYAWDKRAQEKGLDQPLKTADHVMDMARYFVLTIFVPLRRRALASGGRPLPLVRA